MLRVYSIDIVNPPEDSTLVNEGEMSLRKCSAAGFIQSRVKL